MGRLKKYLHQNNKKLNNVGNEHETKITPIKTIYNKLLF